MSLLDRVKAGAGLTGQDVHDRPRLTKTLEYLERKNIELLMHSLLAELLEELPQDPRTFLVNKLNTRN